MILGCQLAGNRSYLPFLGLGREASGDRGSHLSRSHWRRGSRPPSEFQKGTSSESPLSHPGAVGPAFARRRATSSAWPTFALRESPRGEQQQQAGRAPCFFLGGASLAAFALSLVLALALISPGSFPPAQAPLGAAEVSQLNPAGQFCVSFGVAFGSSRLRALRLVPSSLLLWKRDRECNSSAFFFLKVVAKTIFTL